MIKKALIELVQESLFQFDKTAKYHDRIVEGYITMAANSILGQLFRKDTSNYDLYAKEYRNVEVLEDEDTGQFYSEYPAPIVQTIDVRKGVRSINTMRGSGLQFAPVRMGEMEIFEGLDIVSVSDVVGYIPERERILYMGTPTDEDYQTITEVRMRLVVPFTEYEMTEDFHIPGGSDVELFEAIVQLMRGIPPKDQLNDEKERQWTE